MVKKKKKRERQKYVTVWHYVIVYFDAVTAMNSKSTAMFWFVKQTVFTN